MDVCDNYFFVQDSLVLFYLVKTIYLVFVVDAHFYLTTVKGILSLAAILTSAVVVDGFTLLYGTLHILTAIIFISFAVIAFVQLGQINGLLKRSVQRSYHHHHHRKRCLRQNLDITRFIRRHTETLLLIFAFDRYLGPELLSFLLCQVPVNTYLLTRLLLGQFNSQAGIVFLNFIVMQYVCSLFFHLLSGFYCTKIHQHSKALYSWSALQLTRKPGATAAFAKPKQKTLIRVHLYLGKFAVSERYGLTYNGVELMSFSSFFKVRTSLFVSNFNICF